MLSSTQLPIEYPWGEALKIYSIRIGLFFTVVLLNLVCLGILLLLRMAYNATSNIQIMTTSSFVSALLAVAVILLLALAAWRGITLRPSSPPLVAEYVAPSVTLPEGAIPLYSEALLPPEHRTRLVGAFMVVSIGTYGLNQVHRLLNLMWKNGLEELVGSVLVVEYDAQLRTNFLERVPAIFRDRVVYSDAPAFAGGMGNRPISEVLDLMEDWGLSEEKTTQELIDLHLRRNSGLAPTGIWFFLSLGGQAPLGLPILDVLSNRFRATAIVGLTALPVITRLRIRFMRLQKEYERYGILGWVLEDNLETDPDTADLGLVTMLVGLSAATLQENSTTQPNNIFSLAFPEEPGGFLVYQVVRSEVVAYSTDDFRQHYYVNKNLLVSAILDSLRQVERGNGVWSAKLPVGDPDSSVFDLVMIGVPPDALKDIQDEVKNGKRLRHSSFVKERTDRYIGESYFGQPNYETIYSSIVMPVNHDNPTCNVFIVRLIAVHERDRIIDEIVKPPRMRFSRIESSHSAKYRPPDSNSEDLGSSLSSLDNPDDN